MLEADSPLTLTPTIMKLLPYSILALSTMFLFSCNERKQAVEDRKDATEDALERQKDALAPAARDAARQVDANAEVQKANIKAQAKTTEAQIEADKKKVEAAADAAKAKIDAEEKR